jgi:hypothetical protein
VVVEEVMDQIHRHHQQLVDPVVVDHMLHLQALVLVQQDSVDLQVVLLHHLQS